MVSTFPHLTGLEFEQGCSVLSRDFELDGYKQNAWTSVELVQQNSMKYLRISKTLPVLKHPPIATQDESEIEEDNDKEVLPARPSSQALIHYDIVLSPTYRVPVLYIHVSDPQHRYPPTMATLYDHLVPAQFKAQTERVGVIGGVTVTVGFSSPSFELTLKEVQDHPATSTPVFFIHPCQTADVMEASIGTTEVTVYEYLVAWIGAMGKAVGLDVPIAFVGGD